jgi:hypothetical protein
MHHLSKYHLTDHYFINLSAPDIPTKNCTTAPVVTSAELHPQPSTLKDAPYLYLNQVVGVDMHSQWVTSTDAQL